MKTFYQTLLLCSFLISSYSFGQCPEGGQSFYSQQDIDQFLIDYPNCTIINGYLFIRDLVPPGLGYDNVADIQNLNGLQNIQTVTGSLVIRDNPMLENL